ncbi:MCM2/3/5 family-domain-containing protein [Dimargaris cristalligena]|uniref:DNA replication licensing factor MCM5 n=1 Tax=Dimargaris cristalligena TaxID=215637 RepID=A0A4Q0A252_9FUNG|nr:MCM2/3/5 family-domain-containing protein [Dimargaris cristalligena]|eukprot:RKP39571.1 MCM2/3/5 family-domain-containing protein [Dimargaris cristalligena]
MAAQGWDTGRIYTTSVLPGEVQQNDNSIVEQELFDFLQNFCVDNQFVYRDQLRQNLLIKNYVLEVDMQDLISYDENLAHRLSERPSDILPLFESAVRRTAHKILAPTNTEALAVPECQVTLRSNANMTNVRNLDSAAISKLVRIAGIVIAASALSSKATHVHLMCRFCRGTRVLPVSGGLAGLNLPRTCTSVKLDASSPNCPMDPYVVVHDKCKFVDQQTLKLQEAPDLVPVGELPRHLMLTADRYLINKVVPGTRVTVTGIFSIFQNKKVQATGAIAIRSPYLRLVGIEVESGANSGGRHIFTAEEEQEFINMSRQPDFYETFTRSIAPSIYGNEDIKRAIACLLFGGSKKILPDGMGLRGDINVLLLGDPGTAKSQLLKFVERVAPISVYTSGKGSSAAGLTASVIRDPGSREFYLEGGAMVLADGGVVCIDEFDKMREEDRVAIHEAMEQQTISIAKAGITTILNSRTSVLAAANPVFGRYDDMKSAGDNIDFQTTILSRFDMIFIVRDEHSEQRDKTIAKHVMNVHMNSANPADQVEGEIDVSKMKRYVTYCKSKCAPRLSTEAAEKLSSHFVQLRSQIHSMERDNNERSSIPITVRQLEAIIRISESLAKMALAPIATEEHVEEALRLFRASTIDAVQTGQVEGVTRAELQAEVQQIEKTVRRRLVLGSTVSTRALKDQFLREGYTEHAFERALNILVRQDTLSFSNQRLTVRRSGA